MDRIKFLENSQQCSCLYSLTLEGDFANIGVRFKALKVIPIELIVVICVQSKAVLCDPTIAITTVPSCVVKWGPVSPSPVSLITRISPSKPEVVALRNTVEVSDEVVLQSRPH